MIGQSKPISETNIADSNQYFEVHYPENIYYKLYDSIYAFRAMDTTMNYPRTIATGYSGSIKTLKSEDEMSGAFGFLLFVSVAIIAVMTAKLHLRGVDLTTSKLEIKYMKERQEILRAEIKSLKHKIGSYKGIITRHKRTINNLKQKK